MYLSRELVHGDERLRTVLNELGYTTGAGYQIWPSQEAFREDLWVYIAENIEYASLRSMADKTIELAAMNLPFEQHILTAGDLFIEAFLGREEFYLKLRFFEMGDDRPPKVTAALRDAYEQSAWEAGQLIAVTLERFGRRLCRSLEMTDLTVAITAALEGYALRDRLQSERVATSVVKHGGPHHAFSLVFLAIMQEFTEPIPE